MAGRQGSSTRRDPQEALAALTEAERADINTTAVGIVRGYDPKTQTATVQPKLSMMIGGEKVRAPELQSVPVMHPRAGGVILHKPPKNGDEVMVHFAQRPLDGAIEDDEDMRGENTTRMHHISDAVAVPAAHSKGKQLANLPTDRMHFGSEDGKSGLQIKEDGSFDLVRNGDSLWKVVEDLATAFRDHMNGIAPNDKKAEAQAILDRVAKIKAT
ncbi:Gp138 family membrane-puncturing spike protein [Methylorubrum podarium]|uniref:Gp138 family membrane-puncturing spike protein n=1 Tax=Methylorubrum podarium TaxID=200476 RepID=UPI003314FC02